MNSLKRISAFMALMLAIAILSEPMATLADEWIAPLHHVVITNNGMYMVRIIPGESWGDTVGFEGSKKGAYARGEFNEKQADRSFKVLRTLLYRIPLIPSRSYSVRTAT